MSNACNDEYNLFSVINFGLTTFNLKFAQTNLSSNAIHGKFYVPYFQGLCKTARYT